MLALADWTNFGSLKSTLLFAVATEPPPASLQAIYFIDIPAQSGRIDEFRWSPRKWLVPRFTHGSLEKKRRKITLSSSLSRRHHQFFTCPSKSSRSSDLILVGLEELVPIKERDRDDDENKQIGRRAGVGIGARCRKQVIA